ncbi:biotin carboxylase [Brevibacterium sp. UCMA 11754]|uniref:biotin carboxylase n=1 Tax=Brevibacterium sp. UCMA 11754 TaxID=2749198 RepID=UPI001F2AEAEA|nr:biotin carboxylase [Brevibacterium sp. UCMA 11754]MCF2571180.1 biotin carboxylase [Brevibacterium sp. UCMA 11754]
MTNNPADPTPSTTTGNTDGSGTPTGTGAGANRRVVKDAVAVPGTGRPVNSTEARIPDAATAPPQAVPAPAPTPASTSAPDPADVEVHVGTDAAYAGKEAERVQIRRPLRNISEVRHFFRTNITPIYFIGATPFNLLGLDRWVRNFSYITYYDGWDGGHPRVFSPRYKPFVEFDSGEAINNWLLLNAEVRAHMTTNVPHGERPKVAMVFFDEETERICRELGYDLILPSATLRNQLDSKIETTKLGNEAGAFSVPNVLTTADTYAQLNAEAEKENLGTDLVVQTPYGDSGKTTFFIAAEEDWNRHKHDIIGEQLKIMKRINNTPVAVEAVITSSGVVVGPFLTELAGFAELTPYKGGWCGNEMTPDVLTADQRTRARELVRRMGEGLRMRGYRGFFEVDVLVDLDTDDVWLGELNPRISGASAITNVTAGAYADVPLFLFHLLEYIDVEFDLDVDEINERWEELSGADEWSQMVIKETADITEYITHSPLTGQYFLDQYGTLTYKRAALDWHPLQNGSEVFFLRIFGAGEYRWKGADLGVLVTKNPLQTKAGGPNALSIRAKHFIDSIRAMYAGVPVAVEDPSPALGGPGAKGD